MNNNFVTLPSHDPMLDLLRMRQEEFLREAAQARLARLVLEQNRRRKPQMRWRHASDEQDRHVL